MVSAAAGVKEERDGGWMVSRHRVAEQHEDDDSSESQARVDSYRNVRWKSWMAASTRAAGSR